MRIIGNDPSTPRQAQIVASGTLSTGDAVVVNADGTVSVVAGSDTSAGTPVVFDGQTGALASTFDSNSNKVVVAIQDQDNSSYGTAVVGTVSGTSISFGTPVVFNSGGSTDFISATFDSNSNKVVIAYRDGGNSSRGTAIVGTVSGTSISFGSSSVFNSTGSTAHIASTFDLNSNKVVIAYNDYFNSQYGTAVVGTVSGTSISFGSETIFESGTVEETSAAFDSSSNKVVISYQDNSNSSRGTAIVGTVSGTSISFGSAVVFESASGVQDTSTTFDSNSNKIAIAYRDGANSGYGTAIIGTVSGTSISFGTKVVFDANDSDFIGATFDSNSNRVVISYRDRGNSDAGSVVVGVVSGTSISFDPPIVYEQLSSVYNSAVFDSNSNKVVVSYRDVYNSGNGTSAVINVGSTNLTANNYIGTAASGAADTQRAKINLKGAVDENQSGLTAGQSYYVQVDGTLSTTAGDPSVFAGTAVAATKLIVKG